MVTSIYIAAKIRVQADNHFCGQILLKLAENVNNGIPLFCVIFKMNSNVFALNDFELFKQCVFFIVQTIFIVPSFEHAKFRSVAIYKLPCVVPELQAFICLYF